MRARKIGESNFRSRVEYLWYLVFIEIFDKVFYESVKINAGDLHYTPDFLVNSRRWIEIKGNSLTKLSLRKAIDLHKLYKIPVTIIDGFPMRHLDDITDVRVIEIKNGEMVEISGYRSLENVMLGIGLTSHNQFQVSNERNYAKFYQAIRGSFMAVYMSDRNVIRTDF